MVTPQPLVLRWGIISTGQISTAFVKDILLDPKTRGVHDVAHRVTAVGSRSIESANSFVHKLIDTDGSRSVAIYGNYTEVYNDPDVDAIYIGPYPPYVHYSNAVDAIKAGKHVLVEKPATTNAEDFRSLAALAKAHGVFLMEAMWTHIPLTHRILDPKLGGGAILDLSQQLLHSHLFALAAQAQLSCNINIPSNSMGVTLRFRHGNILIPEPIYCPKWYTVQYFGMPGSGKVQREETVHVQHVGGGWHFQADEVARCVRDGKLESSVWGHDKTLLEMEIFDEVRRQGGYSLPGDVERVT
ncbi:hypothetical protein BGW80DRAFT_1436428 [Lactifluus volemus]|nr:hypothetical protein BGW80DRAFT_1436428 [Lactifluus volemus]